MPISQLAENNSKFLPRERVRGLIGSARSWFLSELALKHELLIAVVPSRSQAEEVLQDLEFFIPSHPVHHFPGWETIPFEPVSPQRDISAQRLGVLSLLNSRQHILIVTSPDALIQRVLPAEILSSLTLVLKSGMSIPRKVFVRALEAAGYQTVSVVESVGEVTHQGLVTDLYPPLEALPLRILFSGDTVQEIRRFEPDSQRTIGSLEQITILPVREAIPFYGGFEERSALAIEQIKQRGKELETPAREIARHCAYIRSGFVHPGMELISAVADPTFPTFFSYLPPHAHFISMDEISIEQKLETLWQNIEDRSTRLESEHYLIPRKECFYLSPQSYREELQRFPTTWVDQLEILEKEDTPQEKTVTYHSRSHTELIATLKTRIGSGQALKPLERFLAKIRRDDTHVAFVVGSDSRREKLFRALLNINIDARSPKLSGNQWLHSPTRYPVVILQGSLTAGFQLREEKVAFIAEQEIFLERSHRHAKRSKTSIKKILGSLSLLHEGDHVVHNDYGIGIYRGLAHLDIEGSEGDFLHIQYADSVLYVPVQNIGKVQKFVASEGQSPVLDKLGSRTWVKTKQKVKESVALLAGDLIKLYASRAITKGWRFDPAGAEDERFAEEFPYDETPDQLKAIKETLKDMASDRPMDRLVCGDVGFGKTEVALRAAFKCVQHGRQVAVLVPTTILAEQHFQSFAARFHESNYKVGVVSRFKSSKEIKETLEKLAKGEIDIIIGTHRLLSRDVAFKDIGLAIIDEEHRFGVKQKERLKVLKKQVDVLTLTATPIPRTLHMSMLGIRDISLISTPPTDRRVIRTYVAAYDDGLVRDVVLREIQRGGQVFFVHNRIESIDLLTIRLQELIPEARFQFAHGQMSETELEKIMQRFLTKELDVLVSTSIIESGIDIPNANTIIIDRADTFGLAQLYQLRGRVGRSARQAYAYFLIPKARKLGNDAHKRLLALQALDDLGLGFNLAVRDLEIRGAGNLLGKEQSGSVLAVGFELYTKILREAILNLKGQETPIAEVIDPEIKAPISSFIPSSYAPDVSERLVLYQRFSAVESEFEADQLFEEIQDRFGPPPTEVSQLHCMMKLRAILRTYGVVKAEVRGDKITLSFHTTAPIELQRIFALETSDRERFKFGKNLTLTIKEPEANLHSAEKLLSLVRETLRGIGALEK